MTAPSDLIRRGDAEAAIEAAKMDFQDPEDGLRAAGDALRALPADPVAEAAVRFAELLMSDLDESESMGPAAWDEALTAVRAAVAARAKETVPPALKPGDLAHEPSCIHAKNGSTGMIDARGRCAFCTPTKKENTR